MTQSRRVGFLNLSLCLLWCSVLPALRYGPHRCATPQTKAPAATLKVIHTQILPVIDQPLLTAPPTPGPIKHRKTGMHFTHVVLNGCV